MNKCLWNKEWEHRGIKVIDCCICGFKHQHPIPSEHEVEQLYANEYYQNVQPGYYDNFLNNYEHYRLWAELKKEVAEGYIGRSAGKRMSVLDIGSSFGQFLDTFAKSGWRTVGVEPSPSAAKIAKDFNQDFILHCNLIERVDDEALGPPFNLVHMRDVINHVRSPFALIHRIDQHLLSFNGLLIIETGNDFSVLQKAICKIYDIEPWWITPDHISYFNRDSLVSLIEKFGMKIQKIESIFPMEIFPLMGDDYFSNVGVGKECHKKRMNFELNLAKASGTKIIHSLYETFANANIGRSIIVYAQKG